MHTITIQIPDSVYAVIADAAKAVGQDIETFAAEHLRMDFCDDDVTDSFFTPEILAEIDEAVEEANRGGSKTLDEVVVELAIKRKAWREAHQVLNQNEGG